MKLLTASKLFTFVLSALLPSCLWADAGSFTLDQIMNTPFASGLVAAPTKASVAWIENDRGRRNIWVAEAPEWKGRRLTSYTEDDGQEIADLTWSPDGTYLLFARGGDFENGGENPNPNLSPKKPDQSILRVDIAGGVTSKLAVGRAPQISPSGRTIFFIRGGQIFSLQTGKQAGAEADSAIEQKGSQSALRWSPDGEAFAFVSERGNHSFVGVYRLSEKTLRYLDPSVDSDVEPVWSPDSRRIAFLRIPATSHRAFFSPQREGPPWSIRVADARTGAGHEVFCAKDGPGSVFHEIEAKQQIFWTAGDRLVFAWERTGWNHLYSIPVNGGSPSELTPGDGMVEHVAESVNRTKIFYSTNIGDIDRRHLSEVSVGQDEKTRPLTTGEGIEWQPTPIAEGDAIAYLTSTYNQKAHAVIRLANGETRRLSPDARAGSASDLVKPQPVLISAADGMQIHGQLFLPPHESGGRHPALIFFHGGSRRQMLLGYHYMYYYSNAYSLNEYLANQGYVVLSVNYRSGIGYGLNFREAINYGARGGSEFNDVIGAGLYMKARPDVDPNRIGVWGGSYGGYLTAMALSRASDLFAAGVDFHGVHDWSSLRGYMTRGEMSGDPSEARDREEAARIAFESSPMASISTWRSPVLLIHGDDDRNVEFSQTIMLVEALRQRKVTFEQLIFPNEIHDFLLHRHWIEAYSALSDFFARKLKQSQDASLETKR